MITSALRSTGELVDMQFAESGVTRSFGSAINSRVKERWLMRWRSAAPLFANLSEPSPH